jgi:hypothetical protein
MRLSMVDEPETEPLCSASVEGAKIPVDAVYTVNAAVLFARDRL